MPAINSRSYSRLYIQAILDLATSGQSTDKHTVAELAQRLYGRLIQNATNPHRNFGIFLHWVRSKSKKRSFDNWLKRVGLKDYFDSIKAHSMLLGWICFDSLTDKSLHHLFAPNTSLMDDFHDKVMERFTGQDGPFSSVKLQMSRSWKAFFFHCLEELENTVGFSDFRSNLAIPSEVMPLELPAPRNRGKKECLSATDCVPISWIGSKRRLANVILDELDIPEGEEFVEPMAGAAVVSLMLKARRPDVKLWINDAYTPIYALYRSLQENPGYIIDKLYTEGPDEDLWKEYHQEINDFSGKVSKSRMADLGWKLWYVLTYSFGQLGRKFGPLHHCRQTLQLNKFLTTSRLLQGARITNLDYREVIDESKGTFYIDPPYLLTYNSSYYHPFEEKDHTELCRKLKTKRSWLLSYDNCAQVKTWYGHWCNVKQIDVNRSMGRDSRKFAELLISSKS